MPPMLLMGGVIGVSDSILCLWTHFEQSRPANKLYLLHSEMGIFFYFQT